MLKGGDLAWVGMTVLAVLGLVKFFPVRQISDLRNDVNTLTRHVSDLEAKYDDERSLKHKAYNDVARTVMALDLVRRLAAQCTCGALEPVIEIIERMSTELETMQKRVADAVVTTTTTTTTGDNL